MSSRPRVLMLAYCCSPYHGSEEAVGWNVATEVAKCCDVTVITEEHKFGPPIRKYLADKGPLDGLQFVFEPEKAWAHTMWSLPGLGYLSYKWWHQRALQTAKELHANQPFDLAHQLNIIAFREPGYLHELGIPFVWGPVGGGQEYPNAFLCEASRKGAAQERIRSFINRWQQRYGARRKIAAKRATALAANRENLETLRRLGAEHSVIVSEVSTKLPMSQPPLAPRSNDGKLRILWSGIHHTRKALSLLLKALAHSTKRDRLLVTVLGKGDETTRWKQLANSLGVNDMIDWAGWLPHQEAVQKFAESDVFAFTSLRDTTGTVVVESLGRGLPVICLDHQGVGEVINDSCGIKIPVGSPEQVAVDIALAFDRLVDSPEALRRLSQGAWERAQEYTAEALGRRILDAYRRAVPGLEMNSPVQELASIGS